MDLPVVEGQWNVQEWNFVSKMNLSPLFKILDLPLFYRRVVISISVPTVEEWHEKKPDSNRIVHVQDEYFKFRERKNDKLVSWYFFSREISN